MTMMMASPKIGLSSSTAAALPFQRQLVLWRKETSKASRLLSLFLHQNERRGLVAHSRSSSSVFQQQRRSLVSAMHDPNSGNEEKATGAAGLSIYDSLSSRQKMIPLHNHPPSHSTNAEEAQQQYPARGMAWYTCGPTVYGPAHLGHARTYITMDILRRIALHQWATTTNANNLDWANVPRPLFIMNITDVDDKILNAASEQDIHPIALARSYEADFWRDMDALNVMRPDVITRVTEHVDDVIVPYIQQILDNGFAYVSDDHEQNETTSKSVYFDVTAFEGAFGGGINRYGKLAHNTTSNHGGDNDDGTFFSWQANNQNEQTQPTKYPNKKRDPRDFVLWKGRTVGDEALSWDSPWGSGRPGWHIECSAMIDATMEKFPTHKLQVHAGGIDLKFPHHTNEIAQAEAHRGMLSSSPKQQEENEEWIPHWVHTGHLHIKGLKMSKSLKNFITIQEFLSSSTTEEGEALDSAAISSSLDSPADDFRLWCLGLSGSYRDPTTFSDERINEAKTVREKIVRFLIQGEEWIRLSVEDAGGNLPRRWNKEEYDLHRQVAEFTAKCRLALCGFSGPVVGCGITKLSPNGDGFDGSAFLDALVDMSVVGRLYLNESSIGKHPIDPIGGALAMIRQQLSIVGFSHRFVQAGVAVFDVESEEFASKRSAATVRQITDAFVDFRATVRANALSGVHKTADGENGLQETETALTNILTQCDEVRDVTLPTKGIELFDTSPKSTSWRFCVPKLQASTKKNKPNVKKNVVNIVSVNDMFKVGQYEGMFKEFDDDGLPTKNADGTEVSKTLRKKLTKKQQKRLKMTEKKSVTPA